MRTKTLALSALIGMLGSAAVMAQQNVYSINAVGYINLSLAPGFNMIAVQLVTSPTNTVVNLFPNPADPITGNGPYDNCEIFKFNPVDGRYDNSDNGDAAGGMGTTGWDGGGTITINPGEAVWFDNGTGGTLSVTVVGSVPQGTNSITIYPGFNMLASPVPFSGDLVQSMQFTNYVNFNDQGSQAFVWENPDPALGHPAYNSYSVDLQGGNEGVSGTNVYVTPSGPNAGTPSWDGAEPALNVGQGFWYESEVSPANTTWTYTQVFSINP